ncbi:hypothetical protein [Sphingomonas sp. PP-F2F-A104-K0414]|nr:hypothetical protein [Sphingomonas sp. PP-F2F-A104-K0414]
MIGHRQRQRRLVENDVVVIDKAETDQIIMHLDNMVAPPPSATRPAP